MAFRTLLCPAYVHPKWRLPYIPSLILLSIPWSMVVLLNCLDGCLVSTVVIKREKDHPKLTEGQLSSVCRVLTIRGPYQSTPIWPGTSYSLWIIHHFLPVFWTWTSSLDGKWLPWNSVTYHKNAYLTTNKLYLYLLLCICVLPLYRVCHVFYV